MQSINLSNNSKKENIFFSAALFILIPFSGYYTVKIGFSLIHFAFIIGVMLIILGSLLHTLIPSDKILISEAILLVLYLLGSYAFIWRYDEQTLSPWINTVMSPIYFISIMFVIKNTTTDEVFNASRWMIWLSIFLLFIDLAYRVLFPSEILRDDLSWYAYKTSSLMYPDTNSVGLFSASLFGFLLGLRDWSQKKFKMEFFLIFILLICTLSRASIFAVLLVIFFRYFSEIQWRILKLILFWLLIFVFWWFFYSISSDESFLSKFWIAGLVYDLLLNLDILDIMFGFGPGNSEFILGAGSHLLLFTLLLELGVFGTVVTILLWNRIASSGSPLTTPLILIFVINGFSFSQMAIPWLYTMAAILMALNKSETHVAEKSVSVEYKSIKMVD